MRSLDENSLPANDAKVSRVQTLVIGRLVATFLLLVASWVWHSGTLRLSYDNFPDGLLLVFVLSVGLTIVYFFLLRLSRAIVWQLRVQFVLDVLLTTWLVWRTGDLSSPYITLYIVIIGVGSFFLKPLATLLMAMFCSAIFVAMSALVAAGVIESTGIAQPPGKFVQIVSFHVVAFLVVGLLSSRLSDRHSSGEELRETAKSLASLRLLHERIIESIRSGLITTDLDGTIFTFNAAAAEITGHRAEDVTGENISAIFGDIRGPIAMSVGAAEAGEQAPRFETELSTPEGFLVRVGYSIAHLYSREGEASGLIITFQDVTQIRSMEENVRRKDRLAAVGRVAAGLAHEIRNPLGAMRGAIQVLGSSTPEGSAQASLMEIVLKESDRLNGIITNFLSYARPATAEFADVDIREVLNETLMLLKHSPDIKENHELASMTGDEPIVLSGDAAQLKQIFWNLSRNAILAMPEGGKLTVSIERILANRIRITFEDTGCGMPPEQVERLFEPFSSSRTGGTGLGLSIVYQIVRDHNGSISVRSRENKGTTIIIDLPTDSKALPATPKDESDPPNPHLNKFLKVQ
ncbi:MAG: PAS domain S-box protein [Acidobacteria bacterium OLB17]|nr:MAG: PAS domain S-box protein [Acidobacteria bacterium OLB17]MCZ2389663.1 PAS domain S-box protein [Acidobacteriota bacterium]